MKLKLHENSLFAILGRSPWWVSAMLAAGVFGLTRFFMPIEMAVFATSPFALIAAWILWKQLRKPSAARIAKRLEGLRAMPWEEFSRALEQAWQRDGYAVKAISAAQADFELARGSRTTLVACKRWKATRTGIEPLRELEAAGRAREVHECVYVAAGEITAQARELAAQKGIRLMEGAELAILLRR